MSTASSLEHSVEHSVVGRTDVTSPSARLEQPGRDVYCKLAGTLSGLTMNTLFARAVLEQDAPGRVFAYPAESPAVCYVVHGYGMSLLWGDSGSPEMNASLLGQLLAMPRAADEWLQVGSDDWADRLTRCATPAPPADPSSLMVEQYTRVNFQFSPAAYKKRRAELASSGHCVRRVDRSAYDMPGSVIPRAFFRNAERFLSEGTGFSVIVDGEPVSLAFSSFVTDSQLELGIETRERYRGRGLARLACVALIDDCLARGREPVWACRLENKGSFRLAESLGFTPVRYLPYFRLRAGSDSSSARTDLELPARSG